MFIGFQADADLVAELDRHRGRKDRSLFIREAIAEKLRAMGVHVPEKLIYPPDRAQKVVRLSTHKLAQAAEQAPPYRTKRHKSAQQG